MKDKDRKTHEIPPAMIEAFDTLNNNQKKLLAWVMGLNQNTKLKFQSILINKQLYHNGQNPIKFN